MPEKETCEFQFYMGIWKSEFSGWGGAIFSITPTKHVTLKNKRLDLGILQHLEQLLWLGLGWVISAYPPTMNITPKNKKLD